MEDRRNEDIKSPLLTAQLNSIHFSHSFRQGVYLCRTFCSTGWPAAIQQDVPNEATVLVSNMSTLAGTTMQETHESQGYLK